MSSVVPYLPKSPKERYNVLDRAAYRFGYNYGYMWLGPPVILPLLIISVFPRLAGDLTVKELFDIGLCGLLWITLPGSAFISAAMSTCPPAETVEEIETRFATQSGRAMFRQYLSIPLKPMFAVLFGEASYRLPLFWYAREAGRPLPLDGIDRPLQISMAIAICMILLKVACHFGSKWGESVRLRRSSRPMRFLYWCWRKCKLKWE